MRCRGCNAELNDIESRRKLNGVHVDLCGECNEVSRLTARGLFVEPTWHEAAAGVRPEPLHVDVEVG